MTNDQNFVKNEKTKISKSHAHFQIMMKHSAKFQVNSIKHTCGRSCRDKVQVSKGHNFFKNGQNKNQKPYAHLHMIRQSIKFQISPMKDVRGVAGTRSDGRKEGRTE